MFYKTTLFSIIFLVSMIFVFAQQNKDPITLAIVCNETNFKKPSSVIFIIEFINNGTKTIIIPNKIVSGDLQNIQVNLGFEILRVFSGDTIDVLKIHNADINAQNSHFNNEFKLEAGEKRLVKVEVDGFYFNEKGEYMIRFGLKKKNYFEKNLRFKKDIFSNWKIIHTD